MRFTLTRRKLLNVHKKVRERTSTLDLYMFYMYMYRLCLNAMTCD